MSFQKHLIVIAVLAQLAILPAAWAQAATDTAGPPAAAPTLETIPVVPLKNTAEQPAIKEESVSSKQLDEIVVTATKRATSVRKIPASVTALTGRELEQQGIQGIQQIIALVPGVNLTDPGQGEVSRITIRGIASTVNTNLTTGTLFGDVPFSDPFVPKVQLDPNPFDMATVEILKGPQGTLFGGTGLNDMVRYVPEAPKFDAVQLKYFTQYDAYPGNGGSAWTYGGMLNAPFAGDTAAIRLLGFHRDIAGYTDDLQSGKKDVNRGEQYGFRGAVAWRPDDDWKISLLGQLQRTQIEDIATSDNFDGRLERSNTPRPSPSESRYYLGNLAIERAFSWGNLVSQTSYTDKDFGTYLDASRTAGGGMTALLGAADTNHSEAFSQELRVVSPTSESPWKYLAGAFYYDLNVYDCAEIGAASLPGLPIATLPTLLESLLPGIPLSSITGNVLANPCAGNVDRLDGQFDIAQLLADVNLTEKALFGELTRSLGSQVDITLGGRLYRTASSGSVSTSGALYTATSGGMSGSRDAASEENGFSPKASIVYRPLRNLYTYLSASKGFRFGGPQIGASTPTTTVPPSYKSDSLWNYELGLRSDWFERSLRIDTAAYVIDWKDPQVNQISGDGLIQFIDNVGGVKGIGVDLALRYLPPFLKGLTFNSLLAYNKTETTEAFTDASGTEVPAGSPWPASPRWQASNSLAYTLPVSALNITALVRNSYIGSACNAIVCSSRIFGYRTWDANLALTSKAHPSWPELSLSLNNLTDERGINNVVNLGVAGMSNSTVNYIPPRALIARISGRF